jgi:uncharacterized protein
MFTRIILQELEAWKNKPNRKPLILRGARQVGKTTIVDLFSKKFDQYIYLNLEKEAEANIFNKIKDFDKLVEAVFFLKNKIRNDGKTLIFIDEIQDAPEAIRQLRYFFEQAPDLYVIAAGALLDTLLNKSLRIPVGRVEYLVVRPVSFEEFLIALDEKAALEQLKIIPLNEFTHEKLLSLFHTYTLIGGMPEVVQHYATRRDLTALGPIYDSLLASYLDDVEKYAPNTHAIPVIRHAIRASLMETGNRIKFQGFGRSNYNSREMGEALRTLEKAMLIHLVYPATNSDLPSAPDLRKSPRLHFVDTGLFNYFSGVQKEIIGTSDLNQVHKGKVTEHIIGQEIISMHSSVLFQLVFWVREKKSSGAKLDFLLSHEGMAIPVEVKSGASGKLRSLHQFMEQTNHNLAVRFYSGNFSVEEVKTPGGKSFRLLNLPYFLVSQIKNYLNWMMRN